MRITRRATHFIVSILACLALAVPAVAADHAVTVSGVAFAPVSVTIQVGDKVIWSVTGGGHTVTSGTGCVGDGLFDSGFVGPGGSFEYTFNTAGTYDYFCIPHCGCCVMVGVVVVEEAAECMLLCPLGDGGRSVASDRPKSPRLQR